MKVAMLVEYDGTDYAGWQVQPNAVTVQQKIEEALETIGKGHITVFGAGRTDSGVHANNQCAHFETDDTIPAEKYSFILNTRLPKDIRIKKSWQAADDFHCRFSAKGKRYIYRIFNAQHSSALMGRYTSFVPERLDIAKMQDAAKEFVGTHDFAAFCAAGSSAKTTVRTVTKVEVEKKDEIVSITVEGTGFLYNMVRIMAGTLIEVGKGKRTVKEIRCALEEIQAQSDALDEDKRRAMSRTFAGATAEACGLTMDEVFY